MKKNAPSKAASKTKSAHQKLSNTNSHAQRQRLLKALRTAGSNGITTIQARHELNIMAPAPRIFELKHNENINIQTIWSTDYTPEGHPHRVARYVLMPGFFRSADL